MAAPAILATEHLGLDIGGAAIVADVSLEVLEGEFLGIIGPNGAGKTSFFNLLTGLYRPTSGRVRLDGRDVTHAPPHRRTHAGVGRTFQISSVFPQLTAFENVRLAAEIRLGGTLRIWRRAYGVREPPRAGHVGARPRWSRQARTGARREAGARRQAQARAGDGPRTRSARDPARRADGRRQHGGGRPSWSR